MGNKTFKMVTGTVSDSSIDKFSREITRLLGLGWKLHGSPISTGGSSVAQAMVQKQTMEDIYEMMASSGAAEDTEQPTEIRITVANDVPVDNLASWLYSCCTAFSIGELRQIAGMMIRNREGWYPDVDTFDLTRGNPFCKIELTYADGRNKIINPE